LESRVFAESGQHAHSSDQRLSRFAFEDFVRRPIHRAHGVEDGALVLDSLAFVADAIPQLLFINDQNSHWHLGRFRTRRRKSHLLCNDHNALPTTHLWLLARDSPETTGPLSHVDSADSRA